MPGRPNIPGAHNPADNTHRRGLSPFVIWDMSATNGDNSRDRKLGNFRQGRGAAVALVGKKTGRVWMQDGQGGPSPTSILPFEPDNWTPRFHDKGKPTGKDSVWALRMICEHDNAMEQIAHRSTMVIDQGSKQNWSWIADQWWITGLPAEAGGPGLAYAGDGFLQMLGSYATGQSLDANGDETTRVAPSGGGGRGRLSFNMAENQGLLCDSARVGQLAHVLCFLKPAKTRTKAGRPDEEQEIGIRSDAKYYFGPSTIGRWRLRDIKIPKKDDDGDWKRVHLVILDEVFVPDDGKNHWPAKDGASNTKRIEKKVIPMEMWGAVKVPKPEEHCHDYSYHSPPPSSSSSSSSGGSVITSDGGGGDSGTGSKTDPGSGTSPKDPGVPTIDPKYTNGDGTFTLPDGSVITPDAATGTMTNGTMQTQSGWSQPHSPTMGIRGNIYPKDATRNPLGTFMAKKRAGYVGVQVKLRWCLSDELATGEAIEINCLVAAHVDSVGPAEYWRQSFCIKAAHNFQAEPQQYDLMFRFTGFDQAETMFTVLIERRNDVDPAKGVNSSAEFVTIRNELLSIDQVLED